LVIFGAGGDLTKRLLMPALYNLAGSHLLSENLRVLGIDHSDNTDEGWRSALSETMQSFTRDESAEFHAKQIDAAAWGWVRQRLSYLQGDFEQAPLYGDLTHRLQGNVVFYLAVPARFFGPIIDHLGAAGLLKESGNDAFRRVVIEKPFGADLSSAKNLNARILKSAAESQFYRIDHFLGKETVQSILAVRFANAMYEPVWCRDFIDHVQITAAETIGVEQRGSFYEATGALRDMVPNHLFQLLCMTAIEPPSSLDADAIRTAKAKLVECVKPIQPEHAVRGQYTAGKIAEEAVAGYLQEPHVSPDSATETYVALKLAIENERWSGVPFYLRTGKRLIGRRTEIAVRFKKARAPLFADAPGMDEQSDLLRIQIDPTHGIETILNVKVPGPKMQLAPVATSFRYDDYFQQKPNVGYETLLYDCMIGDATLFQRADNIETSWAAIDPLLHGWGKGTPELYAAGSEGPAGADALLAREGRQWLKLDPK
jgi:glucose-6-phosphate 1-dehydrogenase